MKIIKYALIAAFVALLGSGTALAHKVNLFAYAEGGKIYTESYFPTADRLRVARCWFMTAKTCCFLKV
jgi:hypothetical protein